MHACIPERYFLFSQPQAVVKALYQEEKKLKKRKKIKKRKQNWEFKQGCDLNDSLHLVSPDELATQQEFQVSLTSKQVPRTAQDVLQHVYQFILKLYHH